MLYLEMRIVEPSEYMFIFIHRMGEARAPSVRRNPVSDLLLLLSLLTATFHGTRDLIVAVNNAFELYRNARKSIEIF